MLVLARGRQRHISLIAGLAITGLATVGDVVAAPLPQVTVEELRPEFTIYEWEGEASDRNYVANPAGVAFDDEGNLFVLDVGNHRIAVFSSSGEFLRAFGRAGEGPGEFGFGRDEEASDIAVDGDRVLVTDAQLRRIHIFQRDGTLVDTSTVALRMSSLAVHNGVIYLRTGGFHPDQSAEILVQAEGEGPTPRFEGFAEPMIPPDESPITRYNQSQIAAGPGGRLMQAYWWWPLTRLHLPGATAESFHGKEWWIDERHDAELITRLQGLIAGAKRGVMPNDQTRFPFIQDIEYVPSDDSWVTLVNGNTVHFFGDDRRLRRHLNLFNHAGGGSPTFVDIGISRDGSLLCAADPRAESLVACYRLATVPLPLGLDSEGA